MTIVTGKNVLDRIVAHKREEVAARKQRRSLNDLKQEAEFCASGQLEAAFLKETPEIKLMLEIKPASPSAGVLAQDLDLSSLLDAYNHYGVAISVLTDQHFFGGSLDLLATVARQTKHPVLCKDFILDPYQVYEASRAGAATVLLIVKMLDQQQLLELTALIRSLGMTPLVEIQNSDELEQALEVKPSVLLINNRDLQNLAIDLNTTLDLSRQIPSEILRISASGIESRADIERLKSACNGFLIGSALMRQPPEKLSEKLLELTGL